MWRSIPISQSIATVSLIGNMSLIFCIFYRRYLSQTEETQARVAWEKANQRDFGCYSVAKRFFDQCQLDLDDKLPDDCDQLAEKLGICRKELCDILPQTTPAMRSLPLGFRV